MDHPIVSFLETIQVENGTWKHIGYHNNRFNNTRASLLGIGITSRLEAIITLPDHTASGIFKCRITYNSDILKVEYEPYTMRKITSLKLIVDDRIDYRYKYADRSALERLYSLRGDCDDILIIRNGLVTDTSYANIAFWDGRRWITPAKPLLAGTCRARLLEEGRLVEGEIRPADLPGFSRIRIFNAMMDQDISLDRLRIVG